MAGHALPKAEAVVAVRPRLTRRKHTTAAPRRKRSSINKEEGDISTEAIVTRGRVPEARQSGVDGGVILESSGTTLLGVTVPDGEATEGIKTAPKWVGINQGTPIMVCNAPTLRLVDHESPLSVGMQRSPWSEDFKMATRSQSLQSRHGPSRVSPAYTRLS